MINQFYNFQSITFSHPFMFSAVSFKTWN